MVKELGHVRGEERDGTDFQKRPEFPDPHWKGDMEMLPRFLRHDLKTEASAHEGTEVSLLLFLSDIRKQNPSGLQNWLLQ